MPGLRELRNVPADYTCAFKKVRSGITAADAGPNAAGVVDIDLSASALALTNQINLWANLTAGAGNLVVTLYAYYAGLPAGTWLNLGNQALGAGQQVVSIPNLMAGDYRLVVYSTDTGTWDLYASYTDLPTSILG